MRRPKGDSRVGTAGFPGEVSFAHVNLRSLLDTHIGRLGRKVETRLEFMGAAQAKIRNLGVICV